MAYSRKNRDTHKDVRVNKRADNPAIVIVWTFLDTTWRLVTPTIGLLLVGIWLDGLFETKPVLMFVGLLLGVIIAALLVLMQVADLSKIKKEYKS